GARPLEADLPLTGTGVVLGTPGYMSPEQVDGGPLDGRSDLFGLGCVLYRAATGAAPFQGETLSALLLAVARDEPRPPQQVRPDVPPALSDLILKLLAKRAEDRPPSAQAVAELLRAIEATGPGPAGPAAGPPGGTAAGPPTGRRGPAVVAAVAAVAAVAVVLVLALWRPWQRPPARDGDPGHDARYQGSVDVLVWSKDGGAVRRLRLGDAGALPL